MQTLPPCKTDGHVRRIERTDFCFVGSVFVETNNPELDQSESILFVTDHEGRQHVLPALDGWRVMEVIRDWGIRVKAECGGACACGSCHVYVDDTWTERLHPPTEDELSQLDTMPAVEPNSRLSCQILMSAEINGLQVRLAPGSEAE